MGGSWCDAAVGFVLKCAATSPNWLGQSFLYVAEVMPCQLNPVWDLNQRCSPLPVNAVAGQCANRCCLETNQPALLLTPLLCLALKVSIRPHPPPAMCNSLSISCVVLNAARKS